MVDPRRELRLLVADAGRVLVAAGVSLPLATVEPGDGTTVAAARRWLRDDWSLEAPVLEVFFDYEVDVDAGPIPTLLGLDAPLDGWASWTPPSELAWQVLDEASIETLAADVTDGLRPRTRRLLREAAGLAAIPASRPPWSRPGWYARTRSWTTHRLEALGITVTGPLEQVRHWGISAVGRIPTDHGTIWCKSIFPAFAHEPLVTKLLSDTVPEAVVPVIAGRREPGYLLLRDVGSEVVASHADLDDAAIRALVGIQRTFVGRVDELRAVGCPDRRFEVLPALLAEGFAEAEVGGVLGVSEARAAELVGWVRDHAHDLDVLGFPETVVHGDFHPDNVAVVDGRPVIYDWSDTPTGHPLIDTLTWVGWFEDEPERGDRAWRSFLAAWADVCPPERVEERREVLVGLVAAYHLTSYMAIVRALEEERKPEHHGGLRLFFGRLDAIVPGTPVRVDPPSSETAAYLLHDDADPPALPTAAADG